MNEHTLHFDNAREAQDLLGRRNEYLPRIERALGARLTARDRWLRVEGEEPAVSRTTELIESLREARNAGVMILEHTVEYAIKAAARDRMRDLARLLRARIDVCAGKPSVFPRTFGQQGYVEAMRGADLCFGLGPAGTGKTYLAMASAVAALTRNEVSRIILTRPAIEAGESLGFLPGDLQEKIAPYLRPLYDALYDMMPPEDIQRHMERGTIEVAPLAYMRGRTLNHAFVILDEAQNTTPEQMFMFLTRLGFDSKCVVTGDLSQVDLPSGRPSGLLEAREVLRPIEGIVFVELSDSDVVRHALVQRIVQAYRAGRERAQASAETS